MKTNKTYICTPILQMVEMKQPIIFNIQQPNAPPPRPHEKILVPEIVILMFTCKVKKKCNYFYKIYKYIVTNVIISEAV